MSHLTYSLVKKLLSALLALILTLPEANAKNGEWPQLEGGEDIAQCLTAFQIANEQFHLKRKLSRDINEETRSIDEEDETIFEKIIKTEGTPSNYVYWQRKPHNGWRFVLDNYALGWRGYMYSLYMVKEDVTSAQFLKGYDAYGESNKSFTPLVSNTWNIPYFFQQKSTAETWAIDRGPPYVFLSDWSVYTSTNNEAKLACTIHFRPDVKHATDLLPPAVSKLASLLDGTLGSGMNEGTLQPTAGLRIDVEKIWADVALRPWVLKPQHNSRTEVDANLKKWSHKSAGFKKLYDSIYKQYPIAQQALSDYYEAEFDKPQKEAQEMANHSLDIAFTSYFMFPAP